MIDIVLLKSRKTSHELHLPDQDVIDTQPDEPTVYPEQAVVVRAFVPVTIDMAKRILRREEFISANNLWATVQGS